MPVPTTAEFCGSGGGGALGALSANYADEDEDDEEEESSSEVKVEIDDIVIREIQGDGDTIMVKCEENVSTEGTVVGLIQGESERLSCPINNGHNDGIDMVDESSVQQDEGNSVVKPEDASGSVPLTQSEAVLICGVGDTGKMTVSTGEESTMTGTLPLIAGVDASIATPTSSNFTTFRDNDNETEDSEADSDDDESGEANGSKRKGRKNESDVSSEEEYDLSGRTSLKKEPPRVKGEMNYGDLPPIQDLTISVPHDKAKPIGIIKSVVDPLVIVEAFPSTPALNLDSVLFLDHGDRALGQVFDVMGPVKRPWYCVRFNSMDHIQANGVQVGSEVYCAPSTQHASFILLAQLQQFKGTDASWKDDVEPPADVQEFSDDDAERAVKKGNRKRKVRIRPDGNPVPNGEGGFSPMRAPNPNRGGYTPRGNFYSRGRVQGGRPPHPPRQQYPNMSQNQQNNYYAPPNSYYQQRPPPPPPSAYSWHTHPAATGCPPPPFLQHNNNTNQHRPPNSNPYNQFQQYQNNYFTPPSVPWRHPYVQSSNWIQPPPPPPGPRPPSHQQRNHAPPPPGV